MKTMLVFSGVDFMGKKRIAFVFSMSARPTTRSRSVTSSIRSFSMRSVSTASVRCLFFMATMICRSLFSSAT